ncbi:MAG TPA: SRPBCC family protein [Rhodocyclaceae bacterium]|jgi:hypothetical protein|nr:SRPBCC family protein [Rhodocyclaceae bacterium]
MNFEHLVEINDPGNPLVEPLSRNQLWQGLLLRAENPELSVIGLDACVVLDRGEGYLKRELRFGRLRIIDEVFMVPMEHVTYEVMPSENFPASRLRMAIEEPFPEHLFIRFTYSSVDADPEELVRDHLKQAYIQTDNDTVAVIRELAKMGKLGDYAPQLNRRLN